MLFITGSLEQQHVYLNNIRTGRDPLVGKRSQDPVVTDSEDTEDTRKAPAFTQSQLALALLLQRAVLNFLTHGSEHLGPQHDLQFSECCIDGVR